MKSFDDVKPKSFDDNKWREKVAFAEIKKKEQWYQYRVLGGVHSYGVHWCDTTKKDGTATRFPIDCFAYDPDLEDVDPEKRDSCPGCEAGLKLQIKYLVNTIDRAVQSHGDSDFIRALELSPTAMNKIIGLKNLNLVDGVPTSVANPEHGIDIHIKKTQVGGKTYPELEVQKGDRSPLTKKELAAELYDFGEVVTLGNVANARASLIRKGILQKDGPQGNEVPEGVSMPRSGTTQLPPSEPKPQRVATKPAEQQTDDGDEDPEPAKPAVRESAPAPTPESSTSVRSAVSAEEKPRAVVPQASSTPIGEKPSCYGDYLGEMACLRCPFKPACIAASA